MAINLLNITSSTVDTGPYPTGAFTPTQGSFVGGFVTASDHTTFNSATMASSVGGKTYTRLSPQARFGTNAHSLHFFHMDQISSDTSQTATVTLSDAGTAIHIVMFEVTNMGTFGVGAVRNSGVQNNAAGGNTPSVTWSASGNANGNGAVLMMVANLVNPATVTPNTGLTELADVGVTTPDFGAFVQGRNSGHQGLTVGAGSVVATVNGSIAVELVAPLPEGTGRNLLMMRRRRRIS